MKKLFILVLVAGLLIVGYTNGVFLYAKKLISNEPTTHTIQKGEYLSKIALKYYGRADYWRELALINRAPNSDLVFVDEEIVIPRIEVIEKIRKTRWLSKVNRFMRGEEDFLAHSSKQAEPNLAALNPEPTPEAEPVTTVAEPVPTPEAEQAATVTVSEPPPAVAEVTTPANITGKSSSFYLLLAGIGLLFVGSLIALILHRRKRQPVSIPTTKDDEEFEPDYREYLKNKKEDKELVLN